MGGLALSFTSGRRIAARYFEDMEEVARAPRRSRRHGEFPPPSRPADVVKVMPRRAAPTARFPASY